MFVCACKGMYDLLLTIVVLKKKIVFELYLFIIFIIILKKMLHKKIKVLEYIKYENKKIMMK